MSRSPPPSGARSRPIPRTPRLRPAAWPKARRASVGTLAGYLAIVDGIAYLRNPLRRDAGAGPAGPRLGARLVRTSPTSPAARKRAGGWPSAGSRRSCAGLIIAVYGVDARVVGSGPWYVFVVLGLAVVWAGGRFIHPAGVHRDKNRAPHGGIPPDLRHRTAGRGRGADSPRAGLPGLPRPLPDAAVGDHGAEPDGTGPDRRPERGHRPGDGRARPGRAGRDHLPHGPPAGIDPGAPADAPRPPAAGAVPAGVRRRPAQVVDGHVRPALAHRAVHPAPVRHLRRGAGPAPLAVRPGDRRQPAQDQAGATGRGAGDHRFGRLAIRRGQLDGAVQPHRLGGAGPQGHRWAAVGTGERLGRQLLGQGPDRRPARPRRGPAAPMAGIPGRGCAALAVHRPRPRGGSARAGAGLQARPVDGDRRGPADRMVLRRRPEAGGRRPARAGARAAAAGTPAARAPGAWPPDGARRAAHAAGRGAHRGPRRGRDGRGLLVRRPQRSPRGPPVGRRHADALAELVLAVRPRHGGRLLADLRVPFARQPGLARSGGRPVPRRGPDQAR